MAFKLMVFCTLLAYAYAGIIGTHLAPAAVTYSAPAFAAAPLAPAAVTYAAPASIQYTAPALTSQSSNIYRSFGNLGQISTYSKSIDTPFSSVRKADVRVSNPGLQITTAEHIPHALGVAYSPATAVSHVNYVTGYAQYAF